MDRRFTLFNGGKPQGSISQISGKPKENLKWDATVVGKEVIYIYTNIITYKNIFLEITARFNSRQ